MKLKTRKSITKRFVITKRKKILKRKTGQGHFNSREAGKTTRMKRRDIVFAPTFGKTVKRAIPYS